MNTLKKQKINFISYLDGVERGRSSGYQNVYFKKNNEAYISFMGDKYGKRAVPLPDGSWEVKIHVMTLKATSGKEFIANLLKNKA